MTPAPFYAAEGVTLHLGRNLDVLPSLADASVDAIVTDPPYELGFMGRSWDASGIAYSVDMWVQCLRALKPGGHLVAFGGTRTYHRLAVAIEDAGFEVRDSLHWMYGNGFPKSLDVSKAIDKRREDHTDIHRVTSWLADHAEARGITRRDVDRHMGTSDMGDWWLSRLPHRCAVPKWEQWQKLRAFIGCGDDMDADVWRLNGRKGTPGEAWTKRPAAEYKVRPGMAESWTEGRGWTGTTARGGSAVRGDAARWQGWGTALKPAHEPIVLARKPLAGTVAATVLAHGTGALSIGASRVGADERTYVPRLSAYANLNDDHWARIGKAADSATVSGRWPTNVILSHQPLLDGHGKPIGDACANGCVPGCPVAELDGQSGVRRSGANPTRRRSPKFGDLYGAFEGATNCTPTRGADAGGASRFFPAFRYEAKAPASERPRLPDGTAHPTVKPLALMRWLVRLITPPGGLVLDPFAGTGTTLEAAAIEGFRAVGIEEHKPYAELCRIRLNKPIAGVLFGDVE